MIRVIAEHSVELDILPARANILDIGCRGFGFHEQFTKFGHVVYNVDIDELDTKISYHRLAISDKDGTCAVVNTSDPQAKHITDGAEIEKLTIKSFSERVGVKQWDLIKLDVEGEEIKILQSCEHPIAKQVSVEFHAHCDPNQTKEKLDDFLNTLSRYYHIHNDVWESRHCAGFNYWDVLLIAKKNEEN